MDMGKSLKEVRYSIAQEHAHAQFRYSLCCYALGTQLSTLLASAAETPELEMRQKELQDQVDGLESQMEAAVSASRKVCHL
jgi:hypothetical protein